MFLWVLSETGRWGRRGTFYRELSADQSRTASLRLHGFWHWQSLQIICHSLSRIPIYIFQTFVTRINTYLSKSVHLLFHLDRGWKFLCLSRKLDLRYLASSGSGFFRHSFIHLWFMLWHNNINLWYEWHWKVSLQGKKVHQNPFKNVEFDFFQRLFKLSISSISSTDTTAIERFSWYWRLYLENGLAFPQFSYFKLINADVKKFCSADS